MNREIFLITPVRDEAGHLREVIRHVVRQTLRPVLWVMVDDHSTDGSGGICEEAGRRYPWIRLFRNRGVPVKRQLGRHVFEIVRAGYEFGVDRCMRQGIGYAYVGFLDADMFPPAHYFESLVEKLEGNPEMGIVSGGVYVRNGNGDLIWEKSPIQWPWGGARLLRKDCFEEIGGIPPVNSSDAVSAIRAMKLGYKVKQFKELKVIQLRPTSSANGLPAGYYKKGSDDYYLGYSLPYALAKAMKKAWDVSIHLAVCYLAGYVSSYLTRGERIGDPVVREFCRGRLLRRILSRDFYTHSRYWMEGMIQQRNRDC